MKVKIDTRILKGIQFAGSTTFGIYLLERILRERLLFVFDCLEPVIHTMPACLLYILICMMIGTVIVAVLKRIPLIRRYI
jgi:hypothetical protein